MLLSVQGTVSNFYDSREVIREGVLPTEFKKDVCTSKIFHLRSLCISLVSRINTMILRSIVIYLVVGKFVVFCPSISYRFVLDARCSMHFSFSFSVLVCFLKLSALQSVHT